MVSLKITKKRIMGVVTFIHSEQNNVKLLPWHDDIPVAWGIWLSSRHLPLLWTCLSSCKIFPRSYEPQCHLYNQNQRLNHSEVYLKYIFTASDQNYFHFNTYCLLCFKKKKKKRKSERRRMQLEETSKPNLLGNLKKSEELKGGSIGTSQTDARWLVWQEILIGLMCLYH